MKEYTMKEYIKAIAAITTILLAMWLGWRLGVSEARLASQQAVSEANLNSYKKRIDLERGTTFYIRFYRPHTFINTIDRWVKVTKKQYEQATIGTPVRDLTWTQKYVEEMTSYSWEDISEGMIIKDMQAE